MLSYLIKRYIPNYKETERPSVRKAYGNLAGIIGIVINVSLSCLKLVIGYLSGSIAIISDGFHNLVDGASALVSMLSFKLSGREPDIEHPYGHGRIEYIMSLGMSVVVIVVGIQFFIESVKKIKCGGIVQMSTKMTLLFAVSLLGTFLLYCIYKKIAKMINSQVLKAAAADSFSDAISTVVILIGLIVDKILHIQVDGYLGIFVALVICHTGYEIFKESTSTLIGGEVDHEQVRKISRYVKSFNGVLGVHDLMIHNYGPGHVFASIHVEVDAKKDIMKTHDLIDEIEQDVHDNLGVMLTIHMDPIMQDKHTLATYYWLSKMIRAYDEEYLIQDLRLEHDGKYTILQFELVIPFSEKKPEKQIRQDIQDIIEIEEPNYTARIAIKRCYTGIM